LCFGSGLRVSEAISFDHQEKHNGLYKLKSTKGKSERYVAVNDKIVQELKDNHWQPNQTNRFNFAHYCQRVKKEAKLAKEIELTPHTGRRAWLTYQAENGTPLPLLSQMLGHKNIRTTAQYYWKNTYEDEGTNNILLGQKLTEKMNILNKVKDKNFWREYNANRKDYISVKNKERYLKNKEKDLNEVKENELNTIKNTIKKARERIRLNAYQAHEPTKSRLLISR